MKPPKIRKGGKLVAFLFMLCGLPVAIVLLVAVSMAVLRRPASPMAEAVERQRLVEQVAQERAAQPAPAPAPVKREPTAYEITQAVIKDLRITEWSWEKEAFGAIMIGKFTIANDSQWDVKDIKVRVTLAGASGTAIDENTRVIFENLHADESETFSKINMGLIHSQAAGASASIVDCTLVAKRFEQTAVERRIKAASDERARRELASAQQAEATARSKAATEVRVINYQLEQAEKGLPSFQYEVGKRYLRGDGVEKDEAKARAWFEKSAAQGESLAVKALAELKK